MNISLNNLIELKKLPKKYLDLLYNDLEIAQGNNGLPFLLLENSDKRVKLEQLVITLSQIAGYWGEKPPIDFVTKINHKGRAIIKESYWYDIVIAGTEKYALLVMHKNKNNTTLFINEIKPIEINKSPYPDIPAYEINFMFNENSVFLGKNPENLIIKKQSNLNKRINNIIKEME